jgi:hypothetical protein
MIEMAVATINLDKATYEKKISSYVNVKFECVFVRLADKGYNVDALFVFDENEVFKVYKKQPMEWINFEGFAKLPSIPIGFELAHIVDEKFSMLAYRYEDGLSKQELIKKREEVAESLYMWMLSLPSLE